MEKVGCMSDGNEEGREVEGWRRETQAIQMLGGDELHDAPETSGGDIATGSSPPRKCIHKSIYYQTTSSAR